MSRLDEYKQLLSSGVTADKCLFCNDYCDNIIIRGGSKQHSFKLPFEVSLIKRLLITYKQDDIVVIQKELGDVEVDPTDNSLIYFNLSEIDTLKFKSDVDAFVQLKISLNDNSVIESEIFAIGVVDQLTEEMLTHSTQYYYAVDIKVINQEVTVNKILPLVSGSDNIYRCRVNIDSTWGSFDKVVVFKDHHNHNIEVPIENNECVIPEAIVAEPGLIYVGLIGWTNYGKGKTNYEKPTIWSKAISVYPGTTRGDNAWVSSHEYEEIMKIIGNPSELTTEAKVIVPAINELDATKQDTLVSGENIKTINGKNILGPGDVEITAQAKWGEIIGYMSEQEDLTEALTGLQEGIDELDATKQDNLVDVSTQADKFLHTYQDSEGLIQLEWSTVNSGVTSVKGNQRAVAQTGNVVMTLADDFGVTASKDELNYTTGVTSAIQTQLNAKQPTIDSEHKLAASLVQESENEQFVTAGQKTIWTNKYTKPELGIPSTDMTTEVQTSLGKADTALQPNEEISGGTHTKITYDSKGLVTSGENLGVNDIPNLPLSKISDVTTTTTELNYVHGVTSAIQTQLDNKVTKNNAITGATHTKITYDSKGLVTAGEDLSASDIPSLTLSKISDVTATAAEVNKLDGVTTTTTQLNYLNTTTSDVQTQLNSKEAYDATILKQANVVNNTSSSSEEFKKLPLSAFMGKSLQDQIDNLKSVGRFLSIWDCTSGMPTTEPTSTPYAYKTGDYYRVGTIAEGSEGLNYRPNGQSYTGQPSTTIETEEVKTGWVYYYDGSVWLAQSAGGGNVLDVRVNNETIVSDGVANLTANNAPAIPLTKVSDVTATAAEVNKLHGLATTATELGYVAGTTSNIQSQLNSKSSVSVSSSGSATDEVRYITVNGTEKKLSGLPTGGTNGNIIIKDSSAAGGAKWGAAAIYTDPDGDPATGLIDADTLQSHSASYFQSALTVNPTLAGTEPTLTSLKINNVDYKLGGGDGIVKDVKVDTVSVLDSEGVANIDLTGKQDVISDIGTIRTNATAGASAYATIGTYGNIVTHNISEFATAAQGSLADSATQPGDNVSTLTNDAGYTSNTGTVTSVAAGSGLTGGTITTTGTIGVDFTEVQSKITSSAKLSADLISDGTTNKTVTQTEKTTWNGKSVVSGTNDGTNWSTITINGTTKNIPAGGGGGTWGSITGTLSDQTDLQAALDAKQPTIAIRRV